MTGKAIAKEKTVKTIAKKRRAKDANKRRASAATKAKRKKGEHNLSIRKTRTLFPWKGQLIRAGQGTHVKHSSAIDVKKRMGS